MSSLVKLSIKGIRSFGTEERDEATISFSSPLTLIVGQNGCGKTTIIEALKYATCGELPAGTDNGSGFVHDPKLSGLIESRASVKLRINDIKGRNYTVFRAPQVTQKLKRLEFKTIESVITDDLTKESISTRCSDIDSSMCNLLGVSKSILTNVIFCHQEDSDWPLDKGKKMKEKFDAIFGITEYNKCLEHIRQLTNDNKNSKKSLDINLKNSLLWRDEANVKKRALDENNSKLSAVRDEVNKYNEEIETLHRELDELTKKELDISKYFTDIQSREDKLDMIKQIEKDLKGDIAEIFTGTKEELEDAIQNFENNLQDRQKSLNKSNMDVQKILNDEKKVLDSISSERQKLGRLQRDEEQNNERLLKSNDMIKELATELVILVPSEMNESKSEAVDLILEKIQEYVKEMETLQDNQESEEKFLQSKIDDCREKKVTLEHDIKSKNSQVQTNKLEIRKITTDLEEVDKSASTLASLSIKIDSISSQLEELSHSLNIDEVKAIIQENTSERNRLEIESSILDEEVKKCQVLKFDQTELKRLNHDKISKESDIKRLIDKHADSLIHLLKELPKENLKGTLQVHINSLVSDIRNKRTTISHKEREQTTLIANKKNLNEKLLSRQMTLSQDEDRIQEMCRDQDFDKVLKQISASIDEKQYEKGTLTSSEFLYKRYIMKLQSGDPLCPVCHRGFDDHNELLSNIIQEMTKKLQDFPRNLKQTKLELDGLLKKQSELLQLKPIYDDISRIRNIEIPAIKNDIAKADIRLAELRSEIDREENDLTVLQNNESKARSIQSDAVLIDEHRSELLKLNQAITKIEAKLKNYGSLRNLEEALTEQDEVKSKLSKLRKSLEIDQSKLADHNDRMHKLHATKNELTAKLMKIEGGVQERKSLTDRLNQLNIEQDKLNVELDETKKELALVSREFNDIVRKQAETKSAHKIKLEKTKRKISEYERRVDDIQNLLSSIADYERVGSTKLSDSRIILKQLEDRKCALIEKRDCLQAEINATNKWISNQKLSKLNLDNNLKLITKIEEKRKLEEEIKQLKGRTGNISLNHISRKKQEVAEELGDRNRKRDRLLGRRDELQNNIVDMEKDLQKECYKDAENNHRKNAVAVVVNARVIHDLNLYYSAMDWAMIHIHKERMQLINSITRDLWRRIYCGNDLDSIEIKMDETLTTGVDKRRNYNYRVVQIKNGIEMDMPGRCSAGQKVLASLIIRIALAETFSRNCGVIALDEPTTNLDKENIESLSMALADIVNMRMAQKNFQLLVITHDEEFISRLSRVEKVDRYLRVIRNERGLSKVQEIRL